MAFPRLLLLIAVATVVSANNDWSKPCFDGVCEYDLPASSGASSGTLKIWGSTASIADVTPAGGWEIIGCSPEDLSQDIRLVCQEGKEADCERLYSNSGASGKIVRLPESCGRGPFAVITNAWVPEDQSIPTEVARSLVRRDGTLPQVQALHLSTEFGAGPKKKGTAVNFAIRAANVPGAKGEIDISLFERRGSRAMERGLFDWIQQALDAIKSLNEFDVDKSSTIAEVGISRNFPLIDESVSCPPLSANLKIDVDANAHAAVALGIVVSGTVIPPVINEFAIITGLNAELDGALNVNAGVTGAIDTGKQTLYSVALPGLDFPGILTVGPSFEINAQAIANLDINLGLKVGIKYKIDNAQLVFPPNSPRAGNGTFSVVDTPLTLYASPGIVAAGTVEAHLIPTVKLGISALGGIVQAGVFLDVDASANLKLDLHASASGTVVISPVGARDIAEQLNRRGATPYWSRDETFVPEAGSEIAAAALAEAAGSTTTVTETVTLRETVTVTADLAEATKRPVSTEGSATFGGCFSIGAGLDVSIGANADFFGLWNPETRYTLYEEQWELYAQCFGDQAANASKRSLPTISRFSVRAPRSVAPEPFERGLLDLLCASNLPAAIRVTDGTISAESIRKL
ncbi:unnamed protein product [Cyclocybe aegerita]|uniref:Uncharacterized protein n=1 Tax=Cyclocybe aegerita TaxID=1973307 RepID=A0A8S0W9M0_CYCAE|nr:unnamed protein product [Cyclocybe aegerita]